jgi:hypothetical protein
MWATDELEEATGAREFENEEWENRIKWRLRSDGVDLA